MTESQRGSVSPVTGEAGAQPSRRRGPMTPVIVIGAVFLGVAGVVALSRWLAPQERIAWNDFAAAQAEARVTRKAMFLYFTADWCGPCQRMKRTTWADADVAAAMRSFVPARIDVDVSPDLARRYHVETLPLFIIATAEGDVLQAERRGAMDAGMMIDLLHDAAAHAAPPASAPAGP